MFSYEWRRQDLLNFMYKHYNGKIRTNVIEVAETLSHKEVFCNYFGNSKYKIGVTNALDFLKEDISVDSSNLISLPLRKGQHTSAIPFMLEQGESFSECSGRKEGALLIRNGLPIKLGMSGKEVLALNNNSQVIKICYPYRCGKCSPGKCSFASAAEMALVNASPGDDLFLTHSPDISDAKLILENNLRRLVYFQDSENTAGLEYLKLHNIAFRKAGVN
jgi:deoxycytidylate deaminase